MVFGAHSNGISGKPKGQAITRACLCGPFLRGIWMPPSAILTDFALADRTLIADQRDPKRLTPALVLPRLTRNAAAKLRHAGKPRRN